MRISDWSSDVCSSDLLDLKVVAGQRPAQRAGSARHGINHGRIGFEPHAAPQPVDEDRGDMRALLGNTGLLLDDRGERDRLRHRVERQAVGALRRSEEHTSELQSLMRISYAVFCLKTKKTS